MEDKGTCYCVHSSCTREQGIEILNTNRCLEALSSEYQHLVTLWVCAYISVYVASTSNKLSKKFGKKEIRLEITNRRWREKKEKRQSSILPLPTPKAGEKRLNF